MKTKIFLLILIVALLFLLITCASGNHAAGESDMKAVPFTQVKINDAFWTPRMETNRNVTIWHDIQKCEETGRIANFARAGKLAEGEFEGIYFNDSDVYKVLEGAAYSLANHPDPELEAKVDEIIVKIAAAQQQNGYLFTYNILNGLDKSWSNLKDGHELYCAGHLIEAAVAYFQATGKDKFLKVAIKLADHIDSVFGPDKRQGVPGHEELELALIKLYRLTGEERYFRLARYFLDERGKAENRELYGSHYQDHVPVIEQTAITGHAVRAMYLYSAMADVAALSGDSAYVAAMNRLWDDVINHKMYITGGIGVGGHNEGFAKAYFLPNKEAYAETCASIGLALWSHRLTLLHKDAAYYDIFERVLFNGLLSGVALDGKEFFYENPLESDGKFAFNENRLQRSAWFGCSCCPTNIVRFLPSIGGYVYAQDSKGIYVNLYVASEAIINWQGRSIKVRQKTGYPWDGFVKFEIEPESEEPFDLALRIPGWARDQAVPGDLYQFENEDASSQEKIRIAVNNEPQSLGLKKGYACLQRSWRKGDIIELVLPMPVRKIIAHPAVEADKQRVALQRGPIVYCLEEADNGPDVLSLVIDDKINFTTDYRKNLPGGVLTIQGQVSSIKKVGKVSQTRPFIAIPYYSWANRGPGKMQVWISGS